MCLRWATSVANSCLMVWLEVVVCSNFGNIEKKQLGGKRATGTLFDGADAIYICKASPGLCAVEVLWLKAWGLEELANPGLMGHACEKHKLSTCPRNCCRRFVRNPFPIWTMKVLSWELLNGPNAISKVPGPRNSNDDPNWFYTNLVTSCSNFLQQARANLHRCLNTQEDSKSRGLGPT